MAYNYQQMPNYYGQQQPMFPNNNASPDMLNQFKGQYQPQMQMPMIATPTPTNDMIWVLGEVEATSYPVAPNNTVILWDKNQHTIYIKSANAQGVPSMTTLDYKERMSEPQNAPQKHECQCSKDFVHIDEFNALKRDFNALADKINKAINKKDKEKEDE